MNNPNFPPIASPDGNTGPSPSAPMVRGDWKSAPPIVRGWAYPLTWLGIVVFQLLIFIGFSSVNARAAGQDPLVTLLYSLLLIFTVCLNRGLKKGASWAWVGQIVLSCFGLLGFPLGTAIHAYILSQWFKPETKAWFGHT